MRHQIEANPARRLNNLFAYALALLLVLGLAIGGWRGVGAIALVCAPAALLRRWMTQQRLPAPRRWPPTLPTQTLLLAALLPAGLFEASRWPALPAAAILLVLAQRLRQAAARLPFDPVVIAILTLHLALGPLLDPTRGLDRHDLFRGDLAECVDAPAQRDPWFARATPGDAPGLRVPNAARAIDSYLSGRLDRADAASGSNLDALIRDRLPPIEDLLLLGHPSTLGQASGVAILAFALWASYRRLIDWRVPLVAFVACYVALAVLPTPASVSIDGRNWRLAAFARADVGVATGLTFVLYVIASSPALFTFVFLATRGDNRPLHGRAIVVWSAALGLLTATMLLYVSVPAGPYIAMVPAGASARVLDRLLRRRPRRLPA